MKNRWTRWGLWFAFWTMIVLFYSIRTGRMGASINSVESVQRAASQWYIWAILSLLIVRVDRLLPVGRDEIVKRVLWHVPLAVVFTFTYIYANAAALSAFGLPAMGVPKFEFSLAIAKSAMGGAFHWQVILYWLIVGVHFAGDYYTDLRKRQVKTAELERMLAQSRLDALRTQLHPHFLFNALNAISAQVESDPKSARRMLEQLGDLLRMSLEHFEDQEIPLEEELTFLDRYLAIQKVRFEDRLEVSMDVSPDTLDALVPTFVLQPLVENAIRHGVSPRSTKGTIRVAAWQDSGNLHLRVQDDGPGLPVGWKISEASGVGLSNTRERLRRLYGESGQTLEVASEPGAGVRVELTLPFHQNGKS